MTATVEPRTVGRRRWPRRLGIALLVALAAFFVVPFLIPLPEQPDREAEDVAAELGLAAVGARKAVAS